MNIILFCFIRFKYPHLQKITILLILGCIALTCFLTCSHCMGTENQPVKHAFICILPSQVLITLALSYIIIVYVFITWYKSTN